MRVVCLAVRLEVLLLKAARQSPKAANWGVQLPHPQVSLLLYRKMGIRKSTLGINRQILS